MIKSDGFCWNFSSLLNTLFLYHSQIAYFLTVAASIVTLRQGTLAKYVKVCRLHVMPSADSERPGHLLSRIKKALISQ